MGLLGCVLIYTLVQFVTVATIGTSATNRPLADTASVPMFSRPGVRPRSKDNRFQIGLLVTLARPLRLTYIGECLFVQKMDSHPHGILHDAQGLR
jgi:hypothetical protein